MRQTISTSSITILTLASMLSLSLPALGLPRYSVETVEFRRDYESVIYHFNRNGQVLFYSGVNEWVWTTGGDVRQVVPPDPSTMISRAIGPDGAVYLAYGDNQLQRGRLRPNGQLEVLLSAETPLALEYTIRPAIESIAPDGRVIRHASSIYADKTLQISWLADSVDPGIRLIDIPIEHGQYYESHTSENDTGAGEFQTPTQPWLPAVRNQDVISLLDRGPFPLGHASGISADGRWIAGTLLSQTLTGYESVAVRWDREVLTILPPLAGYDEAAASSVNSDGLAIGTSRQNVAPYDAAPTLWDVSGTPHNLLDLLETDKIAYPVYPIAMDEQGRIVAQGYEQIDGLWYDKAFFLTPIPEPAMVGLIAMLGVGLRRVR